jgi:ParB family chromosome partitioning protein
MQTQPIALKKLHVSPFNMRAEKKEPSLKRMAEISANLLSTVREKGVLTPLLVRPNNDGYEILAGRRRYYAARVIEKERGEFPPLACEVRDVDDATALELSTIENVARLDADELTLYDAYSNMIRQGRSVAEIARLFDKPEREVMGCLAIANLLPRIRELYANDELDVDDLRLLTMATPTQQRAWLKLWNEEDVPVGDDLKHWLFGGVAIKAQFALFDLAPVQDKIVGDLFSGDRYFADPEKDFWPAQDEAIAKRRDGYLAAGWTEVVILERGKQFYSHEYVKVTKKEGGRVYVQPTHTGEVRFLEGYITRREAQAAEAQARKSSAKGKTKEDAAPRSSITSAMQNYLDLHRHAVVRLALLARPSDALRLLIAQAIASSGNWSVRPESQRADSKTVSESLQASPAQAAFAAEAKKVRALLAPAFKDSDDRKDDEEDGTIRIAGRQHDDDFTLAVFQRLLKLKDTDVARIAAFVMAETLAAGSAVTDGFGLHAKVKTREHWAPDPAFFALLRDRQSANAMLAEIAGKKAADKLVSAKLKDTKSTLAKLAGEHPTWCPGWMAFPATGL